MPIAKAEIVAVTGPNGIPVNAIIPNVNSTTRPTGNMVMMPRNGRRDSTQKFTTSSNVAAARVINNDCS